MFKIVELPYHFDNLPIERILGQYSQEGWEISSASFSPDGAVLIFVFFKNDSSNL